MLRRELLARITARGLLLVAATIGVVLAAGAASASTPVARARGWLPFAGGSTKKVIVFLRDKPAGLPARSTTRSRIVKSEVGPLARLLRSHGAKPLALGRTVPFVVASVSSAQKNALKQSSAVRAVVPVGVIRAPKAAVSPAQMVAPFVPSGNDSPTTPTSICGTATAPERDPEALTNINFDGAMALGIDGAGVKVGYIAGGIDTTLPDFQRNAKYATPSSPTGTPVVTAVDFSGDPAGTPDPTDASTESLGDASTMAAQGNTTYDLNSFINSSHTEPSSPCDITVTGDSPGVTVLGINVFSNKHLTTNSNFVQAIDYEVAHGVKVLNESFGGNPFPDDALDAVRIADDDAVAAGVTVVASSGDAGVTSTIGSPATDPKMISVGASTTFRAYQQDFFGGINATQPNSTNGTWLDNNISSFSSGGFTQANRTVDLVAPGDLNWALCSPNQALFETCADENGNPTPLQLFGGTSESSPLTAGAAADVIQAYEQTHSGADPSPALIKQILLSTATDIDAPAEQQGAGLLNIGAAVKEAMSINGASGTPQGGLLIGPNQINVTQDPGHKTHERLSITNTADHPVTVNLSTRALTKQVGHDSGTFCLNPTSSNITCNGASTPPTANTFQIWSGATEVYQEETFTVPDTGGKTSRLNFSADYQFTGQSSLLHVALYDPSGAYAGYSAPQGLADFQNIQVTNPKPGTWTAVFFTVQTGSQGKGTKGPIDWSADTWTFGPGDRIGPGTLHLAPGQTQQVKFAAKSPHDPGDTAQSVVVRSSDGSTTTIPVTVRTLIKPDGAHGGTFSGVLTGGNGRGADEVTNTYQFDVHPGVHDIAVHLTFPINNESVVAFLTDPEGNTVANSSNTLFDSQGNLVNGTAVDLYKDNPQPGRWTLALAWLPPFAAELGLAGGAQLSMPFTGQVQLNQVHTNANLPHGGMKLKRGQTYTFDVTVKNTGTSSQAFFLDPRLPGLTTLPLPDQNQDQSDQNMSLPLDPGMFPFYLVPTNTSSLQTSLSGSGPVTYDIGPFTGDPDLEAVTNGNSASLTLNSGDEIEPGLWALAPSEIGPYGPSGAPSETASATFDAVTQGFDSTVDSATGDLWTAENGLSSTFNPVNLDPGQSTTIPVTITPTASPGTHVSGMIDVDDAFQVNLLTFEVFAGGDELSSLPFSYTVK